MGRTGDEKFPNRARTEEELRASERRYRTVIEQSPLSIHVCAPDGASLLANASWHELWNLREGEEEGANIFEDEHVRAAGLVPYVEESLHSGGPVAPPPLLYDPAKTGREGEPRWLQPFVYPVRDEDTGDVSEVALIIEDVTARKELEERLSYQATHDPLTGLPNRALLLDRLGQALGRAGRREAAGSGAGKVAVLFTDLDNFKYVNDSLGHRAGDELLVGVAERLGGRLRAGDTLARLGGDEFVVVLEGVAGLPDAEAAAEGMARALGEAPFVVGGREVFATTSTGIALGVPGGHGGDAEGLLRAADAAMYRAKEGGKDRHEAYEAGMRARASERLGLERDLRRALGRGEFVLHYQPVVDLGSGRAVGAEALLRWRRPGRGLVPPGEFVPLAEETGLIVPIGRWALGEACRLARALDARRAGGPGGPPLTLFVNLSARQFRDPGLVGEVAKALAEAGLGPGRLALEITEGAAMGDAPGAVGILEGLKALGVRLALDDFGTGYSSMSYLRRFPVDRVKIDRSFVGGLGGGAEGGAEDDAIVSGVVGLAHALGLGVIAEGVETAGQLVRLREMGCEEAQGFLFSGPMPGEALVAWLAGPRSSPAPPG